MKKYVFAFIIIFASVSLMAQFSSPRNINDITEPMEVLDSLIITDTDYDFVRVKFCYGYDNHNRLNQVVISKTGEYQLGVYSTDLQYYEKQNYSYDDNGHCVSYTHFNWEDGWVIDQKIDSTFNAMGECVFQKVYSYSSYDSNYEKREYTYENGNCTERRIYQAHNADTLWEPYNCLTWEYDDWGNCLQRITYLPIGEEWHFSSKGVNTYDEWHNLVLSQSYHWDDAVQQWILNDAYTSYEYNANNLLLRKFYYQSNRTRETKYTYNERNLVDVYYDCVTYPNFIGQIDTIIYTYDAQDSLISKYEWSFHHSNLQDFIYIYLNEYERDEQGRITKETAYRNHFFGNDMELWYQNECIYDEQGRTVTKRHIDYSTDDSTMVEYGFDDFGNLTHESESYYKNGNWEEIFFFDQIFDNNTSSDNILGLERAWNDFIGFMANYESSVLLIGDPYYYWMNDHFPIHHKWESGVWRYSDPDFLDIPWAVNVKVALFYSKHIDNLTETHNFPARIYNIEGGFAVESDEPADIVVYDMLGRAVAQNRQVLQGEFKLTQGIYVVKVNGVATKAVVK